MIIFEYELYENVSNCLKFAEPATFITLNLGNVSYNSKHSIYGNVNNVLKFVKIKKKNQSIVTF